MPATFVRPPPDKPGGGNPVFDAFSSGGFYHAYEQDLTSPRTVGRPLYPRGRRREHLDGWEHYGFMVGQSQLVAGPRADDLGGRDLRWQLQQSQLGQQHLVERQPNPGRAQHPQQLQRHDLHQRRRRGGRRRDGHGGRENISVGGGQHPDCGRLFHLGGWAAQQQQCAECLSVKGCPAA